MKFTASDLRTPRRIFLAVIVVLALVLAWKLGEPQRTGIQRHTATEAPARWKDVWRRGIPALSAKFSGAFAGISLGTNKMEWSMAGDGNGYLYTAEMWSNKALWEFAPCERRRLDEVTPQDARREFFSTGPEGRTVFLSDWRTNAVMIHDGRIILARLRHETQTVHAILPTRQGGGTASFRSRKILPAPGGK